VHIKGQLRRRVVVLSFVELIACRLIFSNNNMKIGCRSSSSRCWSMRRPLWTGGLRHQSLIPNSNDKLIPGNDSTGHTVLHPVIHPVRTSYHLGATLMAHTTARRTDLWRRSPRRSRTAAWIIFLRWSRTRLKTDPPRLGPRTKPSGSTACTPIGLLCAFTSTRS
jgi:hypothetical protein